MLEIIVDPAKPDETLLFVPDVLKELQIARSSLYHRIGKGMFPPPFKDGKRLCWQLGAIRRFYRKKAAAVEKAYKQNRYAGNLNRL